MNFVIHIPERIDRYNSFAEQLKKLNEPYTIIDAVRDSRCGYGTSASFKKVVQFAKDHKLKNITIFEDDVIFNRPDSIEIWNKAKEQLPENFQILLGGCYSWKGTEHSENLIKLSEFSCLHCTYINESAYDILLSHEPEKLCHIDIFLSKQLTEKYMVTPTIALQLDGVSDNKNCKVDYNKGYSRFIIK